MSNLLSPHYIKRVQRHTAVPYLWRAICACGKTFNAGTEAAVLAGLRAHIEEEDPFPIEMTPEDPSHGRNDD